MNLQVYNLKNCQLKQRPGATTMRIESTGRFCLTKAAYEMLGSPEKVELALDRDTGHVFIFASKAEAGFQIKKPGKATSFIFYNKTLFENLFGGEKAVADVEKEPVQEKGIALFRLTITQGKKK